MPRANLRHSGGALERGFRRVVNNVPIGSLLVQTDAKTGEPMLLHAMLPKCLRFRHLAEASWVFLLDSQVRLCAFLHGPPTQFYTRRSALPPPLLWPSVFY